MVLKDGTTFKQALTLYRFDKKLRILLFNEIEKIEVAIRSILANIVCQKLNDKYWITKPEYFAKTGKMNIYGNKKTVLLKKQQKARPLN